jgi:hypothetical protein
VLPLISFIDLFLAIDKKIRKFWPFSFSHSKVYIQHLNIIPPFIHTLSGWFEKVQFMVISPRWENILKTACEYFSSSNNRNCLHKTHSNGGKTYVLLILLITRRILCKYLWKRIFFSCILDIVPSIRTWHSASFLLHLKQHKNHCSSTFVHFIVGLSS